MSVQRTTSTESFAAHVANVGLFACKTRDKTLLDGELLATGARPSLGALPVWVLMCLRRSDGRSKALPHTSHGNMLRFDVKLVECLPR